MRRPSSRPRRVAILTVAPLLSLTIQPTMTVSVTAQKLLGDSRSAPYAATRIPAPFSSGPSAASLLHSQSDDTCVAPHSARS